MDTANLIENCLVCKKENRQDAAVDFIYIYIYIDRSNLGPNDGLLSTLSHCHSFINDGNNNVIFLTLHPD